MLSEGAGDPVRSAVLRAAEARVLCCASRGRRGQVQRCQQSAANPVRADVGGGRGPQRAVRHEPRGKRDLHAAAAAVAVRQADGDRPPLQPADGRQPDEGQGVPPARIFGHLRLAGGLGAGNAWALVRQAIRRGGGLRPAGLLARGRASRCGREDRRGGPAPGPQPGSHLQRGGERGPGYSFAARGTCPLSFRGVRRRIPRRKLANHEDQGDLPRECERGAARAGSHRAWRRGCSGWHQRAIRGTHCQDG
mmetsp:Transcript_60284/g.179561  ORF Transcript_60284/g.179561 Transcript_60284/m.179561 type:complete len:250 (+) Transcript_60284:316-1065(+)